MTSRSSTRTAPRSAASAPPSRDSASPASGSTATPWSRPASSRAYAFAAVSSGDNSNILAARVARETFGVEHVVARIYDPGRAEVYQRLGIPTVATVRWTADQMLRRLLPQGAVPELTDPSGRVVLAEVPLHHAWIGRPLTELEDVAGARVAFLTRLGEGVAPDRRTRSTRTATSCTW